MNYELAKKLKDAGFPQKGGLEIISTDNPNTLPAYIPTLEELIDACGDSFGRLSLNEYDGQITFDAYPNSKKLRERKEWFLAKGTHIEAVANLYLVLHGK